ncbi:hypothetical protein L227DRAFT_499774, partial [Lentinus tigrinus ALCF2SS1-6]
SRQSSTTGVTPTVATSGTANGTWRDVCLQIISEQFPGFEPRNDFDILTLGTTKYHGPRAELEAWLDEKLAVCVDVRGSHEVVMESMREMLSMPSSTITGLKPRGMERNVFLRPIPGSSCSIRLFPGCLEAREYCLDFVSTETGLPVNSPFKFELWAVPNPSLPWIGAISERIFSLENMFDYSTKDIPAGHEKFPLRDGQTYLLKRSGHKDVCFTVPLRRLPLAATVQARDVDMLDLPESVDA